MSLSCATPGCRRRAVGSMPALHCMRCGLLNVTAVGVGSSSEETSGSGSSEKTRSESAPYSSEIIFDNPQTGQTELTLASGERIEFTKHADADFYLATLHSKAPKKLVRHSGVIVAYGLYDKWREKSQLHFEGDPEGIVRLPYIGYLHGSSTLPPVSENADDDGIPWPGSVVAQMVDPVEEQGIDLCGWQAAGNTLDQLADQISNRVTNPSRVALRNMLHVVAKACRARRTSLANVEELRDQIVKDPSDLELLLAADKNTLRKAIPSILPGQQTAYTQSIVNARGMSLEDEMIPEYLENISEEEARHLVAKMKLRPNPADEAGPQRGVTIVGLEVAKICAFERMIVPYAGILVPALAAIPNLDNEGLAAREAQQHVIMVDLRSLPITPYMWYKIFDLWNSVQHLLRREDVIPDSFVSHNDATSVVPPGILLFEDELSAYPNLQKMNGRSAGFVVHTNLPMMSLAFNPLSDTPDIDLSISKDAGVRVTRYPEWQGEGHWIAATLTVERNTGVWTWTIQDSLDEKVDARMLSVYQEIVRELTIYVLAVVRVRSAMHSRRAAID